MSMDVTAAAAAPAMHAMSGASWSGPPQQKMSNLFDAIDTSGSGAITKAQFEQAFQTKNPPNVFQAQGADAIFAKLDPNGTGSVSKKDFVSTMTQLMASLRAQHHHKPDADDKTAAASAADSTHALNDLAAQAVTAPAAPGSLINKTV